MTAQIYALVAAAGLLASLVLMAVRYSWGQSGKADPMGGGFWIASLVVLWLWWMGMSSGLSAHAKLQTYGALAALPVVSAQDILDKPELVGAPVVVSDTAHCAGTLTGGVDAVAARISYSGQEEIEGENSDWIEVRNYGADSEVARFTLGAPGSAVQVDNDMLTVVAQGAAVRSVVKTSEFSSAAGGYLEEYQDRQLIPCDSPVSVTGMVTKVGNGYVLEPLSKSVALLTDRPWSQMLDTANRHSTSEQKGATFWFGIALMAGIGHLAYGLFAKR